MTKIILNKEKHLYTKLNGSVDAFVGRYNVSKYEECLRKINGIYVVVYHDAGYLRKCVYNLFKKYNLFEFARFDIVMQLPDITRGDTGRLGSIKISNLGKDIRKEINSRKLIKQIKQQSEIFTRTPSGWESTFEKTDELSILSVHPSHYDIVIYGKIRRSEIDEKLNKLAMAFNALQNIDSITVCDGLIGVDTMFPAYEQHVIAISRETDKFEIMELTPYKKQDSKCNITRL